jgi:Peptidase family M28/PA domain
MAVISGRRFRAEGFEEAHWMGRLALLAVAVVALGGCSHDKHPSPPVGWSLRSAATAHLRALGRIGDRNHDTRAAGTPGYAESVDYVADRLRAAGYTVRLQDVPYPVFRDRSPPRLEAGGKPLRVLTLRYSAGGRVSAPVARVGLGCSPGEAERARGRIEVAERGSCTFRVKARLAEDAGARGLVVADPRSTLPVGGSLIRPGLSIPSVAAGAEALKLHGSARLAVDTVAVQAHTRNVIAEQPDAEKRVAMVGAHLDSVREGPGINDNGSGVAVTLALAERLRGERGLRFAFWGAEELGLYGSRRYVTSLSDDQRRNITGYVNLDMLGSPNPVRYLYGRGRVRDALVKALRARRLTFQTIDIEGSSDHAPFAAAGISAAGLYSGSDERKTAAQASEFGGKAGRPLDPCYHQHCDVLQRVDRDVMTELGEAAGQALRELS